MTNKILLGMYAFVATASAWLILKYELLTANNMDLILLGVLFLLFILFLLLILSDVFKRTVTFFLVLLVLLSLGSLYFVKTTVDGINKMNASSFYNETQMSVVVSKDSPLTSIKDVKNVEAVWSSDKKNIKALLYNLKTKKHVIPDVTPVKSYRKAYKDILDNDKKVMVINNVYIPLVSPNTRVFKEKTKVLYTYTVREKVVKKKHRDTKGKSFNIYISGIDTYGSISTVSRSDVNIIMSVNPNRHKILLTTTPRDSYVKIPGGGGDQYDKLTHAGIYGVSTSEKALENLYGVKMDYYARINFTSFLTLIDEVGGISVDNDQAFSANGFDFPIGSIELDSKKALVFARERHALDGGDEDRGRNQEKVISAIVNKLSSAKSITRFSRIMDNVSRSVQTDIPTNVIMNLANNELESKKNYSVESQTVSGVGSTGLLPSYAMPGSSLYMLSLDENSVSNASEKIIQTLEN